MDLEKLIRFSLIKLVCIIVLFTQISCTQSKSVEVSDIIDFDSLLENQIKLLQASKAQLNKTAVVNDSTEQHLSIPKDSTAWANELEIFGQLSTLNKPTTRLSYTVQELEDTQSNLRVKLIQCTKDMPLQQVKIFFLENDKDIRRIEAVVNERNILYKSTRLLSMNFTEVRSQLTLTAYSITGGQHVIVGDTIAFSINAAITIPN